MDNSKADSRMPLLYEEVFMLKSLAAGFMALCILFCFSCSGNRGDRAAAAGTAETRTITDQSGDSVVLPGEVNRVVITSPWPLPSVYCLYMGSGRRIVGVHPAVKAAAENSLLMRVAPELAEAETGFIQGDEVNIEELMKLDPDVVFYPAGNSIQKEAYQKAGIPAVAFSTSIAQFNTIETVNRWVELLGVIFGDEVKSDDITAYGREIEAMIRDRIKNLSDAEKPRVLILYFYREGPMQTAGAQHFGQYWLDTTGAVNVAAGEDRGAVPINLEQALTWDPDKIFITNFSPYLVEDFYSGKIGTDDWSSAKAVRNRAVYKFPLGMYRWYPPSSDSPLALLWLAKQIHPDLFADIDLPAEIKKYFIRFYNVELTDADIVKIMNPPREAADGA
jgi:iron complex transport system substrate-binding protein